MTALMARVLVGLGVVAVLLGHHAHDTPHRRGGPRREVRSLAPARYLILHDYGAVRGRRPHAPTLVDAETGEVVPYAPAGVERFDPLGCSPWRDGDGQHHLVIRWTDTADGRDQGLTRGTGLARCTIPDGQVLNRIELNLAVRRVCWAPDRSDRILFAAGDGRLYHYAFPERDDPWDESAPRPLRWAAETPWDGAAFVEDICWPEQPGGGERLLASISYREDVSGTVYISRLWWLRLSPDGAAVVEMAPAIDPAARGSLSDRDGERQPTICLRDGVPWLAYLARVRGQGMWELWAAPLAPEAAEWPVRAPQSPGRKLAVGCVALAPAFSPDGRWVYAAALDEGDCKVRTTRFAVDVAGSPGL